MRYYAGIGSRETPEDVLKIFEDLASELAPNYILRSGGANGADSAFEKGADRVHGEKEIYLPWAKFNNSKSDLVVSDKKAFDIAKEYHPYWDNLKDGAKKLQARNSHQVLGKDLNTPSDFVICWTKDGKGGGGTGQAIRIAKAYHIPVFDAGSYENLDDFKRNIILYASQCQMEKIVTVEFTQKEVSLILNQLTSRIDYFDECIKTETKKRPSNADKIIYFAEMKKSIGEIINKLEKN